jgi:hypothetical protein
MMMRIPFGLAALLALAFPASAQDWPGWRGPHRDGTSKETGFPTRWSSDQGVRWKVPLPGRGYSSPVVFGDRLFLTTCLEDSGERRLICLDRKEGRTLWDRLVVTAPADPKKKHRLNSFASSTPVTDGRHVWVAFQAVNDFRVFCYDVDGKLVWETTPGKFFSVHGFCSSPVLHKDTVIFNGDQDAEAWIVALDKATGAERWRADRPNRTRSYVPPVIFEAAGRPQLVLSGSKCVASYDPDTGKQIWIIDGPTEQYVANVVYAEDVFFVTGGFPKLYVSGIRPDGQGNVTQTHVLWQHQEGASYVPSPVAWGSYFFLVSDTGLATCHEAKTGKQMWKERLGSHHSASPVAAGGYLYFPDDAGATYVVKAGPAFELVAKNELKEECYASPALSRGSLFLRTVKHLYCIGN